jgi:hypothetical protein
VADGVSLVVLFAGPSLVLAMVVKLATCAKTRRLSVIDLFQNNPRKKSRKKKKKQKKKKSISGNHFQNINNGISRKERLTPFPFSIKLV